MNSEIYYKLKEFVYKRGDLHPQPIETKTYTHKEFWHVDWVGVGQFEEGTNDLRGLGIQVSEYGVIREGYWDNGKLFGQGRLIFRGNYYIGEFENDKFNGDGIFWWEDGRKYVGHFKDNKRYEQGTQFTKQGEIERQGEWTDDQYVWNY